LEHTIQDARTDSAGNRREVSRQLQFIELDANGNAHSAGYAPFLNYRPLTEEEQTYIPALRNTGWLKEDLESQALSYAITELVPERHISPLPPVVVGGVLVIPQGLLTSLKGEQPAEPDHFAHETARVEQIAMQTVMETERRLGFIPRDVSANKCGYDIESRVPGTGKLRFIEVK